VIIRERRACLTSNPSSLPCAVLVGLRSSSYGQKLRLRHEKHKAVFLAYFLSSQALLTPSFLACPCLFNLLLPPRHKTVSFDRVLVSASKCPSRVRGTCFHHGKPSVSLSIHHRDARVVSREGQGVAALAPIAVAGQLVSSL
jgi:hypothetical protein